MARNLNLKNQSATRSIRTAQPQVNSTLKNASESVTDLRGKIGSLADEARELVVEVRKDVKPIFSDVQHITDKSKDDIPAMVRNAKDLAARFQLSADKLWDNVLAVWETKCLQRMLSGRAASLVLALAFGRRRNF